MKPPITMFFLIGIVLNVWMLIWSAYDGNYYATIGYMNAMIWAWFAIFMTRIAHKRSVMIDEYSKMVDSYADIVKGMRAHIESMKERAIAQPSKITDEEARAAIRRNVGSIELFPIVDYPDMVIPPNELKKFPDQKYDAEREAFKHVDLTGHQPTTPDHGSKSEPPRESSGTSEQA